MQQELVFPPSRVTLSLKNEDFIITKLISGRVDRASATEAVDSGSIPGRVKPKTVTIGIHSFMLDVQQLKGQCEASIVCGRQIGRWQLDSKTERSLRCLPAKATW